MPWPGPPGSHEPGCGPSPAASPERVVAGCVTALGGTGRDTCCPGVPATTWPWHLDLPVATGGSRAIPSRRDLAVFARRAAEEHLLDASGVLPLDATTRAAPR